MRDDAMTLFCSRNGTELPFIPSDRKGPFSLHTHALRIRSALLTVCRMMSAQHIENDVARKLRGNV